MVLLNLNKTGLWTLLVLQLLCFSLYPACGRPRFEDGDEDIIADEDHEHDEDRVEAQDEDEGDGDEYEENDPSSSPDPAKKPGGGAAGGAAAGSATGTAVKTGPDGKVISETAAKDEFADE